MLNTREKGWLEELANRASKGEFSRREFLGLAFQAGLGVAAAASMIGMGLPEAWAMVDKASSHKKLQLQNPGFTLPKHNFLLDKESPFEVKNILIEKAKEAVKTKGIKFLNVGRGNPDFLNTTARQGFAQLVHFSAGAAADRTPTPDLGFRVPAKGLAAKLGGWLKEHAKEPGTEFLAQSFETAKKITGMDPDELAFQMVDAAQGDFYPDPSRILPFNEKIVNAYFNKMIFGGKPPKGKFYLFATEGATASMIYVFQSLKVNGILNPNDKVGIFTPIFSPYLELPELATFNLERVLISGDEDRGWRMNQDHLRRVLKDKSLKALFFINPSNPGGVSLTRETVETVADMVHQYNPELVIINDTVYANFVEEFHTLAELIPQNTIGCFSYSKYYGVTGWRLGTIQIYEDCVVDRLIAKLPAEKKKALAQRYSIVSTDPDSIPFYNRLEIDSRDVALAHTGGLSTPQQVLMSFFSLFELMDTQNTYKKSVTGIIKERWDALFGAIGTPAPEGKDLTRYYHIIDVLQLADHRGGPAFAEWLKEKWPTGFLFHLAEDTATICLPGEGFAGPLWSLRVALANSTKEDMAAVGKNIIAVLDEYHQAFKAAPKG